MKSENIKIKQQKTLKRLETLVEQIVATRGYTKDLTSIKKLERQLKTQLIKNPANFVK